MKNKPEQVLQWTGFKAHLPTRKWLGKNVIDRSVCLQQTEAHGERRFKISTSGRIRGKKPQEFHIILREDSLSAVFDLYFKLKNGPIAVTMEVPDIKNYKPKPRRSPK